LSSENKNLSSQTVAALSNSDKIRVAIVVSQWNSEITDKLCQGAKDSLLKHSIKPENILVKYVPGSFELTLGAQYFAEYEIVDAIICLGCVIQGETKHFDFICDAVAHGITQLNLKFNKPFVFGVLTTNNQQQAIDRSGGKHGNKGDEAAVTAINMLALRQSFK
jgi:6,7-dimethyl-8-ribityllumazine synthase